MDSRFYHILKAQVFILKAMPLLKLCWFITYNFKKRINTKYTLLKVESYKESCVVLKIKSYLANNCISL